MCAWAGVGSYRQVLTIGHANASVTRYIRATHFWKTPLELLFCLCLVTPAGSEMNHNLDHLVPQEVIADRRDERELCNREFQSPNVACTRTLIEVYDA